MKFILPITKHEVEIYDWLPQKVFEESQNEILGDAGINVSDVADITDDDILKEMGADFLHKMKKAKKELKEQMQEQANRKIVRKKLEGRVTFESQARADRVKMLGMIVKIESKEGGSLSITDKKEIGELIEMLPTTDYALIQSKIKHIEDNEGAREKESGAQSKA